MKKFLLLTVVALMVSIVTPLVLFAESTTTEKLREFNTKKLEMLSYNYDTSNIDGITPVADNEKIGNSARRKNAIKAYLAINSGGLGYEKAATENLSWIVNAFYRYMFISSSLINGLANDLYILAYRLETGPRFYLSKTKHEMAGWYIGVPFSFGNIIVQATTSSVSREATLVGLGISTGYQWIFPKGLLIELGGNLGYNVGFSYPSITSVFLSVPIYTVDFGMGYAF